MLAENERLREALRKIAVCDDAALSQYLARSALAERDEMRSQMTPIWEGMIGRLKRVDAENERLREALRAISRQSDAVFLPEKFRQLARAVARAALEDDDPCERAGRHVCGPEASER